MNDITDRSVNPFEKTIKASDGRAVRFHIHFRHGVAVFHQIAKHEGVEVDLKVEIATPDAKVNERRALDALVRIGQKEADDVAKAIGHLVVFERSLEAAELSNPILRFGN